MKLGDKIEVQIGSESNPVWKERIFLYKYGDAFACVNKDDEEKFKNLYPFAVILWDEAREIKEPVYYYQYAKKSKEDHIIFSDFVPDNVAESEDYEKQGWHKIETSKMEWNH